MNTIRNTVARKGAWLSTIALVAAMHLGDAAYAQATPKPPERMTYQGFIAGSDGVALGNTAPKNYDVIFRVYDAETAGTLIWGEQQTVTVDKGYFSVLLGEGAPVSGVPNAGITLSSLFNSATASDRYVGFTVKGIGSGGTDVDILPRARMMSAPYSFLASRAVVATLAETANVATTALSATTALTATMATNVMVANTAVRLVRDNTSGTELVGNGILTTNTLDIIGVGTNNASRQIKIWNEGGATFTGPVTNNSGTYMHGALYLRSPLAFTSSSTAVLDLGYAASPKATAAGQIAYQNYSGNSLDIIGAGTSDATRRIRFWSEGGMHINSAVGIGHQPATGSYMLYLNTAPSGVSLYASGACFASQFVAFSDRRNKDVVGVSDRSQDLENLRKIRVTDYTMKFGGVGGKRPTKGVIAQELGEVLPNAVSLSRNIIPVPAQDAVSVEKDGLQSPVVVRFAAAHGFQKDERLRLEIDGRTEEVQILNVPDEKSFELSGGPTSAPKQVRVIGREVDDFQSVDYQQIYMTAVSALQEVDRRLQVVEQREAKVMELERKAARVESLERDVAELRKLVAGIQAGASKNAGSASVTGSASGAVASSR